MRLPKNMIAAIILVANTAGSSPLMQRPCNRFGLPGATEDATMKI